MKKILFILAILVFISGCTTEDKLGQTGEVISDIISSEKEVVNDNYIEVIPKEATIWVNSASNEQLMNTEEIKLYNKNLVNKSKYLFDLTTFKDNQKGIIINRTILYSEPQLSSNFVETGLYIGMPIVILEENNNFYKVQSYFYMGWVEKDYVALATDGKWFDFAYNNNFIVITESFLKTNNKIMDMGATLPYVGIKDNKYQILIPNRDSTGNLVTKTILINRSEAHIGYLQYTNRNIYIQAFKYLNTTYGWGDKNGGIDCSSFIANVYRTFGFYLPRNTYQQNEVLSITNLSNLSTSDKYEKLIQFGAPSILYMSGHTMLYLGVKDNEHFIIHASGDAKKVLSEKLPYINNIKSIYQIK